LRLVEGGKVKAEINSANQTVNSARAGLLSLEEDAKNLGLAYDNAQSALKRIMEEVKLIESMRVPQKDSDIQTSTEGVNAILTRANVVSADLGKIANQIAIKNKMFEEAKNAVIHAQGKIKTLTPQYVSQQNQIKPQMETIEKEMAAIGAGIDKTLLEKYKARRKTEPVGGKINDIVVPVVAGRCGGCNFEMSNLLAHKIATDGYVVCEECGRILYKGK